MDKTQYEQAMKLIRNPDTNAEGLLMLDGLVKTDTEAFEANQQLMKQKDESITTLRDSQARMFLKMTDAVPTGTDKEETADEKFDRLFTSKFVEEEKK